MICGISFVKEKREKIPDVPGIHEFTLPSPSLQTLEVALSSSFPFGLTSFMNPVLKKKAVAEGQEVRGGRVCA